LPLQQALLSHFSLAEQASAELVILVDQLPEEKKRFESVSDEDTIGEVNLF